MKKLRAIIGETIFGSRVNWEVSRIVPFLPKKGTILDLGAGTGLFTKAFFRLGYRMEPVDIKNRSYYYTAPSHIYNGKNLPYQENQFAACILFAVLHHTPDPRAVLAEAARVSKRLVIYEDIVTNVFQRFYTYVIDSVLNKEFIGHPHSNKTEAEWVELFRKFGLKIVKVEHSNSYLFMHNSLFFLEKTH